MVHSETGKVGTYAVANPIVRIDNSVRSAPTGSASWLFSILRRSGDDLDKPSSDIRVRFCRWDGVVCDFSCASAMMVLIDSLESLAR